MALSKQAVVHNIGRRIAEMRTERGWTQQQVADNLGITARYVQSVEGGTVNLSVGAVVRWANLFHTPLSSFCEPATSKTPGPGRPRRKT